MVVAFYQLTGKIVAETPLHIGSGTRTGVTKHTKLFIPGSFIRGSFGTCLMKLEGESKLFKSAFGEEFGSASDMFFKHSYPLHLSCECGKYLPASKTLYQCTKPQCKRFFDTFEPPYRCETPGCGTPVRPVSGFRCSECGEITQKPVPTARLTSTAVNRSSQSYAEIPEGEEKAGTLHILELIAAGTVFSFEVIVDASREADLKKIESVLTKCVPDEGVGGSKSRGLGKIRLENLAVNEVNDEMVKKGAEDINTENFSIRLLSPMILEGSKGLEAPTLMEGCRRAYTWCFHSGKPQLPEVTLKAKRQTSEMFSGWSLKSGRRRRVEPAISAGSAYLFTCKERSETLADSLAALEYSAIGAYKPHGCGQVIVEKPP